MADHERGEVVAWKHLEDFEEFTTNQSWPKYYPDLWTPLVRQSDYLEAVAEIERLRAATERAEREAKQHFRQAMINGERAQAAEAERDELRARIEGIDKILEPLTGEG